MNTTNDTQFNMTPCVGRCSTVYGDPICRGCKRFMTEVSFWNQLSLHDRKKVWLRLDQLAIRIIPQLVSIFDQKLLAEFLESQNIRYPKHLSPESWALHCIENFPGNLDTLHQAGLCLQTGSAILSIKALRLSVQKGLYTLSLAERERQQQLPRPAST